MKLEALPDFAKPFKTRGYDVRLVRGHYQLFKISSHREAGKKHPVLQQTYIGTIDPVKGLVDKKVPLKSTYTLVEYGLSAFILQHLKRKLQRAMFNGVSEQLLKAGIIYFMYGHIEMRFVRLSYLSKGYDETAPELNAPSTLQYVSKVAANIEFYLGCLIYDKSDRDYLLNVLRDIKVPSDHPLPQVQYPEEVVTLMDKYGVKR